jgi:GPH family glycoside/pentoside/hexuronide:cation symporter
MENKNILSSKLSLKEKLGFGVCDLGGNALFTIMAFWLMNFLTDTVGLAASLAGTALMIGKVWDAVTDPVMGYLSDHTKTRWGRRRPYIFLGGITVFLTMILMFTNPKMTSQNLLFWWATGAYCALCLAFTILNIPYSALTPELTSDYNERTVLNGYRMTFAVIGTFIGAGAVLPFLGLFPDQNLGYTFMGTVFGFLIMMVSLVTFYTVREPQTTANPSKTGIIASYLSALKNIPYILVLIPWVLNMTATTIVSGTLIYYFKYIYLNGSATTTALLILLSSAMLLIPVWVLISKAIGKKNCYAIGLTIIAVVCLIFFGYGHRLSMGFAFGMMALAGIGLSTTYVFPWSIIPDTIEYDFAKTGERREGIYYGIWTFVSKVGQALAAFLMGWVLEIFHYVPNQALQAKETIWGIRLLFGPIPAAIFILGAVIIMFYPINEQCYQEIMKMAKEKLTLNQ